MLDLDDDALALIRAARGGDDPSAEERAAVLTAFRVAREQPEAHAAPRRLARRVFPRRWAFTWSLAAVVSLGSVGAFADWHEVLRQVRTFELENWRRWPALVFGVEQAEPSLRAAPKAAVEQLNPQPELPMTGTVTTTFRSEGTTSPPPTTRADDTGSVPVAGETHTEPSVVPKPERALPAGALLAGSAGVTGSANSRVERPTTPRAAVPVVNEHEGELALVVAARDALALGRYVQALEFTRQHAAQFASGAFAQERCAIEALALCRGGFGHRLGLDFVQRWPGSLFTPRIVRDCGLSNLVPADEQADTDLGSDVSSPLRKELTP
jgi:hypothetical protein